MATKIKTYYLILTHIGTCGADYLTDHHHQDGEFLIGIPIDGKTTNKEVKVDLQVGGFGLDDDDWKEEVVDELFQEAIKECFELRRDDDPFDPSLNSESDKDLSQAWFLVQFGIKEGTL